jgi:hypothetical protein
MPTLADQENCKMPSHRQITTEHKKEKKKLTKITQNTASGAENGRRSVQYAAASSSDRMYIPSPPLVVSSRKECLAPPCLPLAVAVAPSCAYIGRDALGERAIGGRGGGAVRSLEGAVAMGGGEERSREETSCFMRGAESEGSATARVCVGVGEDR